MHSRYAKDAVLTSNYKTTQQHNQTKFKSCDDVESNQVHQTPGRLGPWVIHIILIIPMEKLAKQKQLDPEKRLNQYSNHQAKRPRFYTNYIYIYIYNV